MTYYMALCLGSVYVVHVQSCACDMRFGGPACQGAPVMLWPLQCTPVGPVRSRAPPDLSLVPVLLLSPWPQVLDDLAGRG